MFDQRGSLCIFCGNSCLSVGAQKGLITLVKPRQALFQGSVYGGGIFHNPIIGRTRGSLNTHPQARKGGT